MKVTNGFQHKETNMSGKLWLDPVEVGPLIGEDVQTVYRDIRTGKFPWEYVKLGRRYKISARSLGLIPEQGSENEAAKDQGQSLTAAA
jgi:hypothetical protein